MAATEGVVFALVGMWKGLDPVEFSVGAEFVSATCQNLVSVGLVSHVPHDAVVGGIVDVVKGYRQFDDTEAGCQVSGVDGEFFYDIFPQFVAHLRQLFYFQFP